MSLLDRCQEAANEFVLCAGDETELEIAMNKATEAVLEETVKWLRDKAALSLDSVSFSTAADIIESELR